MVDVGAEEPLIYAGLREIIALRPSCIHADGAVDVDVEGLIRTETMTRSRLPKSPSSLAVRIEVTSAASKLTSASASSRLSASTSTDSGSTILTSISLFSNAKGDSARGVVGARGLLGRAFPPPGLRGDAGTVGRLGGLRVDGADDDADGVTGREPDATMAGGFVALRLSMDMGALYFLCVLARRGVLLGLVCPMAGVVRPLLAAVTNDAAVTLVPVAVDPKDALVAVEPVVETEQIEDKEEIEDTLPCELSGRLGAADILCGRAAGSGIVPL